MEYTLVNFTKITFTILQNAEFPYAKLLLTAGCFHRRKPSVTEHNTITHDTTPLTTVLANTTHAPHNTEKSKWPLLWTVNSTTWENHKPYQVNEYGEVKKFFIPGFFFPFEFDFFSSAILIYRYPKQLFSIKGTQWTNQGAQIKRDDVIIMAWW